MDHIKDMMLLQETNPEAFDRWFQGLIANIPVTEKIHYETPNSSLDFIEDAIKLLGEDNVLVISNTVMEFGLSDEVTKMFFEDDDIESDLSFSLMGFSLKPGKKGPDRIVFLYMGLFTIDEAIEEEDFELPEGVEVDEDGFPHALVNGFELTYFEIDQAVRLLIHCLKCENNESDQVWLRRDIRKLLKGKYILSFEPSMANPNEGDSLIIRKKEYPKNCYAYKEFNSFEDALNLRDDLFWSIIFHETGVDTKYSDSPSDICTFKIKPEAMQDVVDIINGKKSLNGTDCDLTP